MSEPLMNRSTEQIRRAGEALLALLEKEGLEVLQQPDHIVQELQECVDRNVAQLIVYSLQPDALKQAEGRSTQDWSAYLETVCFLRPDIAQTLGESFADIFQRNRLSEWDSQKMACIQDYASEEWDFEFKYMTTWRGSRYCQDCEGYCEGVWTVSDFTQFDSQMAVLFEKRTHVTTEAIHQKLVELVQKKFQDTFDEILSDPTCLPDYFGDFEDGLCPADLLEEFCEAYGIEILDWEYNVEVGEEKPYGRHWY